MGRKEWSMHSLLIKVNLNPDQTHWDLFRQHQYWWGKNQPMEKQTGSLGTQWRNGSRMLFFFCCSKVMQGYCEVNNSVDSISGDPFIHSQLCRNAVHKTECNVYHIRMCVLLMTSLTCFWLCWSHPQSLGADSPSRVRMLNGEVPSTASWMAWGSIDSWNLRQSMTFCVWYTPLMTWTSCGLFCHSHLAYWLIP